MNEHTGNGPCAGREPAIVDLHEGNLGPEDERRLRAHLEACVRCRNWLAEYAALDAALGAALPRPALSADFGASVRARIAVLAAEVPRGVARARADLEYRQAMRTLGSRSLRRALASLAIVATLVAIATALVLTTPFDPVALLRRVGLPLDTGSGRSAIAVLGMAIAAGTLAWSATRGLLPGLSRPA
jgi:hypothetical protein